RVIVGTRAAFEKKISELCRKCATKNSRTPELRQKLSKKAMGNKNNLRAGKTKCRRCKNVFLRLKGEYFRICTRCREHCTRCDALLNVTTEYDHVKERNQYF